MKKIISSIITVIYIMVNINLFPIISSALSTITVSVKKDSSFSEMITETSVVLTWNSVTNASNYRITYRDSTPDDVGIDKQNIVNSSKLEYTVTGLTPNILYNFRVEALDSTNSVISSDSINVLSRISLLSNYLPDSPIEANGEREIGTAPGLKITWTMPKYFNGTNFVPYDSSKVNYKISIGTDKTATNAGIYNVTYDGAGYSVYKDQDTTKMADVIQNAQQLSYDWKSQIDDKVKPGSIYYMKIVPQFDSSIGKVTYATSYLNSGYTYTPLHIRIGKDTNNNLLCTIYRLNRYVDASQPLINFRYEVYSSIDPNMVSPTVEAFEYDENGDRTQPIEVFLPNKDQSSNYYYKVMARSENLDIVESQILDYNMTIIPSRPPLAEGFVLSEVKKVSGIANGILTNSANLTLEWDTPKNFDLVKNNLRYYVEISAAYDDSTTNAKEPETNFNVKYRLVKEIGANSMSIVPGQNGKLKYTLKGLELFKTEEGLNIANPDNYPTSLIPNRIYYVRMYSKRLDNLLVSDYSIPVCTTIPADNSLNIYAPSKVGVVSVDTNNIKIQWEKISLPQFGQEGVDYSVTYEVYMNDVFVDSSNSTYKPFVFMGDSLFNYQTSMQEVKVNNSYTALVNDFIGQNEVVDRFGDNIKANNTYYFRVRVKVRLSGDSEDRYSDFSSVLAVTTLKNPEIPGDDLIPMAPADFGVATDEQGNKIIDSYFTRLKWSDVGAVNYRLIRTTKPVGEDQSLLSIQTDNTYKLYDYDLTGLTKIDNVTGYVYKADELNANTTYYFSLRAEKSVTTNGVQTIFSSSWVTIPVTTTLIKPPYSLEPMYDNTIDKYHSLKIKWIGDETHAFDIAIRGETDLEYTIWTNTLVTNSKPEQLQETQYKEYYAVISGLKSNTKYYIKIRSKNSRIDPFGTVLTDYSKYIGPIVSRTEYSKVDYEEDVKNKNGQEELLNRILEMITSPYWVFNNDSYETKIKVKGQRTTNLLNYNNDIVIDISKLEYDSTKKSIYIPIEVVEQAGNLSKNILINLADTKISLRPNFIDTYLNKEMVEIRKSIANKEYTYQDVYVKIDLYKKDSSYYDIKSNGKELYSTAYTLSTNLALSQKYDDTIEYDIENRLKDLVNQKSQQLINTSAQNKDTQAEMNNIIDNLVVSIKYSISDYIENYLEGSSSVISNSKQVSDYNNRLLVYQELLKNPIDSRRFSGFTLNDSNWQRERTTYGDNYYAYEVAKPTTFGVFILPQSFLDVNDTKSQEKLNDLDSKYNVLSILDDSRYSRTEIKTGDMVEIAQQVLGLDQASQQYKDFTRPLQTKIKTQASLTKQELAYILDYIFSSKNNINSAGYTPSRKIVITDYDKISKNYYKSVIITLDVGLMEYDHDKIFNPLKIIQKQDGLITIYDTLKKIDK